jgi:hypothetical protein
MNNKRFRKIGWRISFIAHFNSGVMDLISHFSIPRGAYRICRFSSPELLVVSEL